MVCHHEAPPAEPEKAARSLDDVTSIMAARDSAVSADRRMSTGQRWIWWLGEYPNSA